MGDVRGLLTIAATQNGLFTAKQARRHGLSRDWTSHRNGDRISTVFPRVYWAFTGPPPRDVLIDAALMHAGRSSATSHWTAAELWGFASRKLMRFM